MSSGSSKWTEQRARWERLAEACDRKAAAWRLAGRLQSSLEYERIAEGYRAKVEAKAAKIQLRKRAAGRRRRARERARQEREE